MQTKKTMTFLCWTSTDPNSGHLLWLLHLQSLGGPCNRACYLDKMNVSHVSGEPFYPVATQSESDIQFGILWHNLGSWKSLAVHGRIELLGSLRGRAPHNSRMRVGVGGRGRQPSPPHKKSHYQILWTIFEMLRTTKMDKHPDIL